MLPPPLVFLFLYASPSSLLSPNLSRPSPLSPCHQQRTVSGACFQVDLLCALCHLEHEYVRVCARACVRSVRGQGALAQMCLDWVEPSRMAKDLATVSIKNPVSSPRPGS